MSVRSPSPLFWMHLLLCAVLSVLCLLGVARAADVELDMDMMQTIEDLNKSMASNIALRDAKATRSDAAELHELFSKVEAHFQAKGDATDAVELARKSRELSADIVKLVGQSKFDEATDAATNISRACRSCHTFYKKS